MVDIAELKLDEVERLLNDPDVPMLASRVWDLLDELAERPPEPPSAAP